MEESVSTRERENQKVSLGRIFNFKLVCFLLGL